MLREFNDRQGNQDRICKYCLIFQGVAYDKATSIEKKTSVWEELSHTKNGKWSNSDWRVTLNTAKLVVIMRPFEGWSDDYSNCIDHITGQYGNGLNGVTKEDAKLAFSFLYPESFERVSSLIQAKEELW